MVIVILGDGKKSINFFVECLKDCSYGEGEWVVRDGVFRLPVSLNRVFLRYSYLIGGG